MTQLLPIQKIHGRPIQKYLKDFEKNEQLFIMGLTLVLGQKKSTTVPEMNQRIVQGLFVSLWLDV